MRPEIHRLRVNVKSLAAESRIIRAEMRKADKTSRHLLDLHRSTRVRPEARLAHLALAWAKGRTYPQAEAKTTQPVSAQRLTEKVNRFLSRRVEQGEIDRWLGGGQ